MYERPNGLPGLALTVGSSWTEDACPRRFWFRRGEGLRPRERKRALYYGEAWHAVLQEIHEWWRDKNGLAFPMQGLMTCPWCTGLGCQRCNNVGFGPVARQALAWNGTDLEGDASVLFAAAEGWLTRWGQQPFPGWMVVGVEVPLAFPIPDPETGETWTPPMPVVTRPDGSKRFARAGEGVRPLQDGYTFAWESVPAFASIRLDVLWMAPNGSAWVGELKSAQDPPGYLAGLPVDPQVTIYELALEHACGSGDILQPGPGRLAWPGGAEPSPAGWLYDVASSRPQRHLSKLKNGKFSVAANALASVPPWYMMADLMSEGIAWSDPAGSGTWADRIAEATARSNRWYLRESGSSPRDLRRRVLTELWAVAKRRAEWYWAIAESDTPVQVDSVFFRVPVCRNGFCPFKAPCISDGPESRRYFDVPEDRTDLAEDTDHGEPV